MRGSSRRSLYLLALWEERPAVWRLSLEDARTGQRWGFGSLDGLHAFLGAQMEAPEERTGDSERAGGREEIGCDG